MYAGSRLLALTVLAAASTAFSDTYSHMLSRLAEADAAADAAWAACETGEALAARQQAVSAAVIAALGGLPERTPLNARTVARTENDGYAVEKVMFESEPLHHVTAHLFLPDATAFAGRRPAVLITCGHTRNGKSYGPYQDAAIALAKRGMVALVCDPIDQGERLQSRSDGSLWGTRAHVNVGRRALLLGWSMLRFRLWDAMRALDYLSAREEVDSTRLGVTGHSGGGTMASWLMSLDVRIGAAAPGGYLSSIREVCTAIGPQDSEQFVFGELTSGMNHLGHIALRAPSPVLHCASTSDFFPIAGARATAALAESVYGMLGKSGAYRLLDVPGEHDWHESMRAGAVDWMDHWLQDGDPLKSLDAYRALPLATGNSTDIPSAHRVTDGGSVRAMDGERTAYDIMADEAARQKAARVTLTAEAVRAAAGIRAVDQIKAWRLSSVALDGGAVRETLLTDEGMEIPVVSSGEGANVLVVHDAANRSAVASLVASAEGRVSVADLRGWGETGGSRHTYYDQTDDEELAILGIMVGRSLVGLRAEEIIAVARHVGGGKAVRLVAKGRAAIPAAHAYYTEPGLFSSIEIVSAPDSWSALFATDAVRGGFADLVHGAWRFYDWCDLTGTDDRPRGGGVEIAEEPDPGETQGGDQGEEDPHAVDPVNLATNTCSAELERVSLDLSPVWFLVSDGPIPVSYSSVGWGVSDVQRPATATLHLDGGASGGSDIATGLAGRGTYLWKPESISDVEYTLTHVVPAGSEADLVARFFFIGSRIRTVSSDGVRFDLREGEVLKTSSPAEIPPFAYSATNFVGLSEAAGGTVAAVSIVKLEGTGDDLTRWTERGSRRKLVESAGEGAYAWSAKRGVWKAVFEIRDGQGVARTCDRILDLRDLKLGSCLILK